MAVVATNAELPSIIAFIPNKGNDDAMQLSGANELLYAAKASYLYKAIKTKELVDSLKQPTLEKISKKLNIPINEINYQKIQDNIILTDTYSSRSTAVQTRSSRGNTKTTIINISSSQDQLGTRRSL